jgi:hypothetical protein
VSQYSVVCACEHGNERSCSFLTIGFVRRTLIHGVEAVQGRPHIFVFRTTVIKDTGTQIWTSVLLVEFMLTANRKKCKDTMVFARR